MISAKVNAQILIEACKAYGIEDIIVSPGSRNAPLTISFAEDNFFKTKVVVDERSAAFIALGIAQKKRKPVLITCTSGSATLNYAPAIAEAYYQNVPLIIATADRPDEWIGQGEGQCINQPNVFANYCDKNVHLSILEDEKNILENQNKIIDAIQFSILNSKASHINLPFDEPLYDKVENNSISIPKVILKDDIVIIENIEHFSKTFNQSKKIMFICGLNQPDSKLLHQLSELNKLYKVVVLTETTSNLYNPKFISCIDRTLATIDENEIEEFQPDLLISLGGEIISKKIKRFLRNSNLTEHWHIHPTDKKDTYKQLTHFIQNDPSFFLSKLSRSIQYSTEGNFGNKWYSKSITGQDKHINFVQNCNWSDLKATTIIQDYLPDHSNFHLGNSSAVRYVQLFDMIKDVTYYSNRGVSGIDGSTSTALGCAFSSKDLTILLSGDLSFIYDSNSMWTKWPSNFKVIVINNNGGGIFRIIEGPNTTKQIDDYFEVGNNIDIIQLCKAYNIKAQLISSDEELIQTIPEFFKIDNPIQVLEIKTPSKLNAETLKLYFNHLKQ